MGRINKTNKANPVSADEFIIYDSEDTTDDKNITLGQIATFTETQDSTVAGDKTFSGGCAFGSGLITYGQYTPFPTGYGTYVASYVSPTYGARLLGYNGSTYQDLSIGSMPTAGTVSIKSLANGDCNFGYNVNVAGDLGVTGSVTANKFIGDGSELINTIKEITLRDEQFIVTSLTGRSYITIKGNTKITFTLNSVVKNFVNLSDLTINTIDKLDTGTTLTAGKDYSIYLVEDSGQSSGFNFKISLNASCPSGYSVSTSYKIGGFHTLCVSVTSGNAPALATPTIWSTHPAIGYNAGDIIPNSIWCITHRPISLPYGMVYVDKIDKWVDIYLQSGTGISTVSVYGGTTTDTRTQIQHEWDMSLVNKKLATDSDFIVFAEGSNQQTNIYGSVDAVTTGGHVDTASKRMISGYFIEDCCGFLWQWLDEIAPVGGSGWVAYGDEATRGQTYGMPYCLIAGGYWSGSSYCGSRSRNAYFVRSFVYSAIGGRGVSLPLRNFIQ